MTRRKRVLWWCSFSAAVLAAVAIAIAGAADFAWRIPPGVGDPEAIATFERTIVSMNSPDDRYRWQGESAAISEAAKRGEIVFVSSEKGGTCEPVEEGASAEGDDGCGSAGLD